MSSQFQQSPYLRDQRQFPNDDVKALSNQMDHTYIDIASKVNARTIGTYATNFPIVSGEQWYITGGNTKQQTLRRLYVVTGAGNIAHGIDTAAISGFTRIYGTFTDSTSWYPIPYVDTTAFANQVSINVTPTNIVITKGAGVTITSGWVVLEWLSVV